MELELRPIAPGGQLGAAASFSCPSQLEPASFLKLAHSPSFGASLIAQLVKNPPAMQETPVRFLGQEDPWRRDRLPIPVFGGFPGGY